mmetsp:Transcript_25167/g.35446  ORF Transcript_25167/g.35446 Transcript_25167/m.35446 type:complete len:655 (+) Transcript_25167:122-2086(+)
MNIARIPPKSSSSSYTMPDMKDNPSIFEEQEPPSCSSLDMDAIYDDAIDAEADSMKSYRKEKLQESFQAFKEFTDMHGTDGLVELSSASMPKEEDEWEPLPFNPGGIQNKAKDGKSRRRSSMPTMSNSYSPTFSSFPTSMEPPQISFGEATEKLLNHSGSHLIANEGELEDTSLHVQDLEATQAAPKRSQSQFRRVARRGSMPTISSSNFQFTAPVPAPYQNGNAMPQQTLSQHSQPVLQQQEQQQQQPVQAATKARRFARRSSMPTNWSVANSNTNGKRERTTDPSTWPSPFVPTSDPSTWPAPMIQDPMAGATPATGVVPQEQFIQPAMVPLKVGSNYEMNVPSKGVSVDPWEPIVATNTPNPQVQIPQQAPTSGHTKAKRRCSMPSMHVLEDVNAPMAPLMPQTTRSFGVSPLFSSDNSDIKTHLHQNIASPSSVVKPTSASARPIVSAHPRLETDTASPPPPRKGAGGGVRRSESQGPIDLPENFFPSDNDVICGRGKQYQNHSGNKKFRKIIDANLDRYDMAESKPQKSRVVIAIVDQIRNNCKPHGGFVDKKADTGRWFEIGDSQAREKVGHALRFHIASQKRKAKKVAEKAGQAPKPTKKETMSKPFSQGPTQTSGGTYTNKSISEDGGDDFASFVLDTFLQPLRDS